METSDDFKEWFASLNANRVEYMVVGGYALAFHGAPRFTGDIDVFVRPGAENAARLLAALEAFGFGGLGLTADDFLTEGRVVQFGQPPHRLDLLTSLSGVDTEAAFASRVEGDYGGVPVWYISRDWFVVNKQALGRPKDLADLDALGAG